MRPVKPLVHHSRFDSAMFGQICFSGVPRQGFARRKNWLVLITVFVITHMLLMTTGELVTVIQLVEAALDAV